MVLVDSRQFETNGNGNGNGNGIYLFFGTITYCMEVPKMGPQNPKHCHFE